MEHADAMNTPNALAWLVENFGIVSFGFFIAGFALFIFGTTNNLSLPNIIGLITVVSFLYVFTRQFTIARCQRIIRKMSEHFTSQGEIHSRTNENALDSVDLAILKLVDSGGYYMDLIPEASPRFDMKDFFERLGKMQALDYVNAQRSKIVLTQLGVETMSIPATMFAGIVPGDIATQYSKIRSRLSVNDFGGSVDETNKLFEMCLRSRLNEALWREAQSEGKVEKPYDRATLGDLLSLSRNLGLVRPGGLADHVLSSYLELRKPEKHLTEVESEPIRAAESSADLARVFLRTWYS
jgi:hypothetical protein